MCSYNKINGTQACENEYILNTTVKHRLGFKGFITSDWRATHSTIDSANNGLGKIPDTYTRLPHACLYRR
jgi:beta-glucosidase